MPSTPHQYTFGVKRAGVITAFARFDKALAFNRTWIGSQLVIRINGQWRPLQ